jgi:ketosteroid isomerase-like protein
LRLTLGLRKENGRWVVAHEHHSFPDTGTDGGDVASEREVRQLHQRWFDLTAAKDLDGMMASIAEDVVSYEQEAPLQYVGLEAVREVCKRGLEASSGAVRWDIPDLKVVVCGDVAAAWGLDLFRVEQADGETTENWSRATRVFQRRNGAWVMVHQHLSSPLDPDTADARIDLQP